MLSFLLAILFLRAADSHSILRNPQSWNTRESKNNPCGGRNAQQGATVTATAVTAGATVPGRWEVTAGDGNGPISITYVETAAEVTAAGFNNARAAGQELAVQMNPTPQRGTGTYDFTFTAPPASANCQGGPAGNQCYIQVKSTSNWYSCATLTMPPAVTPAPSVGITVAPTPSPTPGPPPTPLSCDTVQDVSVQNSICAGLNGKPLKPSLQTPQERVNLAVAEFSGYVSNGIVFRNSIGNQICQQWLAQYSCGQKFLNCDVQNPGLIKNICKSRCLNTMYECDLDPLHENALLKGVCESPIFSETEADAYGPCPATVPTRTIHLKSISVGVAPNYWAAGNEYPSQRIYKGDKLVFKYQGNLKLYKFPDQVAFDTCEFQSSVEQPGTPESDQESAFTVFTLDTSNTMYSAGQTLWYGSKSGCVAGLKVQVDIIAIPAGASIQSAVSGNPEERPATFPTKSPPGFLGNPEGIADDSGSLEKSSICLFAVFSSLLFILH